MSERASDGCQRSSRESEDARNDNRRQRQRTSSPINEVSVKNFIEQQCRPLVRAIQDLKTCNEQVSGKLVGVSDRISALESQVMLLAESLKSTARAQAELSQSSTITGTSANGMKFLHEFERAGRTNLKNRFREKIKRFCLKREGLMHFSSDGCKDLITGCRFSLFKPDSPSIAAETFGVVAHFVKLSSDEWEAVMKSDKAVASKVENMIGEVRHKVSSNAVHLFEVRCHRESCVQESLTMYFRKK